VTLSYRGQTFTRVKPENRRTLEDVEAKRRITILRESAIILIEIDRVEIDVQGQRRDVPNDAVIVCAGGLLPMALFGQIGVQVQTKYGTT
jgi:thioredoxin reductase (NADPH)